MNGNGKIARLPREIREELNQRLDDNEPGGTLLGWLNGLPAVQALLTRDFGGVPVSKQNLSEWRTGGFKRWQAQREMLEQARELAADASELAEATDGKLTEHLATVLAARYASVLSNWDGEMSDALTKQLRILKGLCRDVVELRRSDQRGERLKLAEERQSWEREKTEEEVFGYFQRWLKNTEVRKAVEKKDDKKCEGRLRQLFDVKPKPLLPKEHSLRRVTMESPTESKPVKAAGRRPSNQFKKRTTDKMVGRSPSSRRGLARSRSLSPSGLHPAAQDKFLSPFPKRLKSPPGEGETLAASCQEPASDTTESNQVKAGQTKISSFTPSGGGPLVEGQESGEGLRL